MKFRKAAALLFPWRFVLFSTGGFTLLLQLHCPCIWSLLMSLSSQTLLSPSGPWPFSASARLAMKLRGVLILKKSPDWNVPHWHIV
jgi:hypothetical protein